MIKIKERLLNKIELTDGHCIKLDTEVKAIEFCNRYNEFKDIDDFGNKLYFFKKEYIALLDFDLYHIKDEIQNHLFSIDERLELEYLSDYERTDLYKIQYSLREQLNLLDKLKKYDKKDSI